MVHVVRAFPPADRQATAEICDKCADQGVDDEITRYCEMAGVVRNKHDLLLSRLLAIAPIPI